MRIHELKLENIGPFKNSEIQFISKENQMDLPPVVIITGENGTGKSIILDSIRTIFMGIFSSVEREIESDKNFKLSCKISINKNIILDIVSDKKTDLNRFKTNNMEISQLFQSNFKPVYEKDFIFDYWTSKLSSDEFNINNIEILTTKNFLVDALNGVHKNIDVTRTISFFDYLKGSKDKKEKEIGEVLFNLLEQIVNSSITNGYLSHVSRINLTPIVNVQGKEISLSKLSSGNLYLIQRFASLLRQVYSICINNNLPISKYKDIEGVLLIDEAENHLHPKWQKVFLSNILKFFPRVQIIVTTHSPFIVSSVKHSRVYVCLDKIDHSTISEETDFYVNSPIEEILRSPLFNTSSFNEDISTLINSRKKAITDNNLKKVKTIEEKLLKLNPEYFNYLKLDEILKNLLK